MLKTVKPSISKSSPGGCLRASGPALRRPIKSCRLAVPLVVALLAATVQAEPPRYEIEFLDRDAIEAPSDALPLGGTVGGVAAISKNGRFFAGTVVDNQDGITRVPFRLDRATGIVEHVGELRGVFAPLVNDAGHLVGHRFLDGQFDVAFWSEDMGVARFESAVIAFSSFDTINRSFNNRDDILVRLLPPDPGPTGAALWNPVLGTEVSLPFRSHAVNDHGVVVGRVSTPEGLRAFAWNAADGLVVLPSPPDGEHQEALGIDEDGQIVGRTIESGFHGLFWPELDSQPTALPCPDFSPGNPVSDCAAFHVIESGDVFGTGAFDDSTPGAYVLWQGTDAFLLRHLLLDPNARCGYDQASGLGELAGFCGIFDPDLPLGSPPVVAGPVILQPVFPEVLDCGNAVASPSALWPPNHELRAIEILGVEAADGSDATIHVTGVRQDEPVDGLGDGDVAPDAVVGNDGGVEVRQERSGLGDGRIYEIEFEATDGTSTCIGSVTVGVPHDQGKGSAPIDSGARYDSTSP